LFKREITHEKKLVIFGCGGFGREVLQLVRDINVSYLTWDCLGFIVDKDYVSEAAVQGLPIFGDIEWLKRNPAVEVVVAVGSTAGGNL
jgi:hypothetical protein